MREKSLFCGNIIQQGIENWIYIKNWIVPNLIRATIILNDSANTYILIDKLEKKGLLERHPNPNDSSISNVVLTVEGRALFDENFPK